MHNVSPTKKQKAKELEIASTKLAMQNVSPTKKQNKKELEIASTKLADS